MPILNSAACTSDMRRLFLLLLFLPFAALAAGQVEVFELRHRMAEDLIPQLRPVVDPDGAVTGSAGTLIVRSSPGNIAELRKIIAALDTAPRQLLISVRHGDAARGAAGGVGAGVQIEGRDGDWDTQTRVRVYGTERRGDETIVQTLRLVEGRWARISAGQALPVPQQSITHGRGGTSVQQSIEYRDVETGFEVRPRVTENDRVVLDIRPYRARPAPQGGGVIEQQSVDTTAAAPLGEWVPLAGSREESETKGRGTLYATEARDRVTREVAVRVERVE